MIIAAYQQLLDKNELHADPAQERAVEALQQLYDELLSHPPRPKGFFSRFRRPEVIKGLYLYGGVGRGKSMLMDLFYQQLPETIPARRVHFHEFMIETHDDLHHARGQKVDAILPEFAKKVADGTRVLCFDEFHVSDVADAMILGRLFQSLFDQGLVIVATSNRAPGELYKGGLQRDRFEPFVKLLREKMTILHLDSPTDYRARNDKSLSQTHYFTPLGSAARDWANKLFLKLTNHHIPSAETLTVKGREIPVEAAVENVARFTFQELCERPHSAEDYLAIGRRFSTILLENVPTMNYDRRNEAKRFMTLIDTFYDQGIDLYLSAAAKPEKLYRGYDHSFEFQRTISRLRQMSGNPS